MVVLKPTGSLLVLETSTPSLRDEPKADELAAGDIIHMEASAELSVTGHGATI